MRKSHIYYIIGVALSLVPAMSWGQGTLSPKTAIALSGNGAARMKAPGADGGKVSAYVTINPSETSWQALGLSPIARQGSTATVRLSAAELKRLAEAKGVEYIQLTSGVSLMLDVARAEAGVDDVHKGVSLQQGYTGKGVVVGIVDAGFDYMHSAFRNPADGSLRIKRVWEQKTASLTGAKAPEKFGYGIELDTPELIEASQGDTRDNSHGTHVAGIAAGADEYKDGAFVGNAPDADIVLVALDLSASTSTDICNAVEYVFDYADEVGEPCVVNLSLGNHEGPHDGTSTFDVMADRMQRPGRLIVGAAGNHRTDKFHICRSFAAADDAPLKTFVTYKANPSVSNVGGNVEIWGEKGTEFTVDLAAYSLFNKKDVASTTVYPADGVADVSFGRYATGTWKVASEVSPLNGKPHVVLTSALSGLKVNHAIALTVTPKGKGKVDVWADNTYLGLDSRDIDGFSAPDASSSTIAEIGGTGNRILTVGAYTTRNEYATTGGTTGTAAETVGDISSFSSYGPTADGRIKPEISAPGCLIISAASNFDNSGTLLTADSHEEYGRANSYAYMQGTSMAAPFVAGIVATWLQAYPQLTPEQLHQIVEGTARRDNFTPSQPDSNWGYGKINALDGLKQCIELETAGVQTVDNGFDGNLKVVDGNIVIGFPRDADAIVSVAGLSGNTVMRTDLGHRTAGESVSIPMPQLPKGVYVLSVKTAASAASYKFVCQ